MPGEQGDLPASPQITGMTPEKPTWDALIRRAEETGVSKPEGRAESAVEPIFKNPVVTEEPIKDPGAEAPEKNGWLFNDESELEGLPPSVHVALRHAERTNSRPVGPMTVDTLRRAYLQIDEAVFGGQVEPEAVQEQLIRIEERIADLDQRNQPQSQPSAVDVSPITQAVESGVQRLAEAAESGQARAEATVELSNQRMREILEREEERARELAATRVASPGDLKKSMGRDTSDLLELFGRTDPARERERWAQVEYEQKFRASFQPNQEPRFYTDMNYQERDLMDARWQLARAAYIAKVLSNRAEDYIMKNEELATLTEEQMERLYLMPGVKPALEWYADFIYNNKTIDVNGRSITIWECKNQPEFSAIRKKMRDEALGEIHGGQVVDFGPYKEELDKLEADAVAWNLIYVSNLLESLDSRYSRSGRRHSELSGQFASDEIRALLHPQEKFEDKMSSGQPWGVFTGWGLTQMDLIKKAAGISRDDVVRFVEARRVGDFWTHKVTKEGGHKVVTIKAPECYPTTTCGSYWERWKLLDKLLKKQTIDWEQVDSGSWGRYLFTTLNQGLKLMKYYNPGTPMEYGKPGYADKWVGEGIEESIGRLGLNTKLSKDELHNLKVWAVYGSIGMKDYGSKEPHINASGMDKGNIESALRDQRVAYFSASRIAGPFAGEKLNIVDLPSRK